MSVPYDKVKSPPSLPPLPQRVEAPRPNPNHSMLYDFDRGDGIGKDLVQKMKERAVINAVLFSSVVAPGKRNSKLIVIPAKGDAHTPSPAPTPRNSTVQSAPASKASVSFNDKPSMIGPEIKTIQDKNPDLGRLRQMKGLSIALTPALKMGQRGRSRTADDVRATRAPIRCSTPHPKPSRD